MKKVRLAIMAVALSIGIIGGFAFTPKHAKAPCSGTFYANINGFPFERTEADHHLCDQSETSCKYSDVEMQTPCDEDQGFWVDQP